ncbi:hypothetical protein [uncultured Desulfobacter sp.]|nr:hypothetical protein [uncultured Desulfobacter sp.]
MSSSTFNLRFKFITGLVLFAIAFGLCISVIGAAVEMGRDNADNGSGQSV